MNRNWVVLVLIVLASSAIRNSPAPDEAQSGKSAAEAGAKSGTAATPDAARLADDNPFLVLCEYAASGESRATLSPEQPLLADSCAAANSWTRPPSNLHLNYIVATIPDPERTHLTLFFDRMVDSVSGAVTASGYSLVRHWLPWRSAEVLLKEQQETDPDKVRKIRIEREHRSRWPGLLLFRAPNASKPHLAVFLVGETPVAGLDWDQMRAISSFFGNRQIPWGLVGPSFSGTTVGFVNNVALSPNYGQLRLLVSGSATNLSYQQRSVVHDDNYSKDALFSVLNRIAPRETADTIAFVSEGETAYGGALAKNPIRNRRIISLRFPRSIAQLRNAFEELSAKSGSSSALPASTPTLELKLKDAFAGKDTVPTFSNITPVAQETVLSEIATTIRREKVSSAVVGATDVLDILFVMRYLRVACPDVRFYTLDSDRLITRANSQASLIGSLAISTYPLISLRPSHAGRHLTFDSQTSQGTFNATLAVLRSLGLQVDSPVEYRTPWAATAPYTVPPVWLTIAGRGGYWPVAIVRDGGDDNKIRQLPDAGGITDPRETAPRLWTLVFAIVATIASAWIVSLALSLTTEKRPIVDLRPRLDERYGSDRAAYVAAASMTVAAFVAVAGSSPWILSSRFGRSWTLFGGICLVLFFAAAGAGLALLLRVLLANAKLSRPSTLAAIASCASLFALWFTGHELLVDDPSTHIALFFADRSLDLRSGVSPTIPFLLILPACFLWCWTSLQRHIFRAERRPLLPGDDGGAKWGDPPILDQQAKTRASADAALRPSAELAAKAIWIDAAIGLTGWHAKAAVAAVAIVAGTTVGIFTTFYFRSVEGRAYDHLYAAILGIVAALIFGAWTHFLLIWSELRRWLEQIELNPLRHAFSLMPTVRSSSALWMAEIGRRNYVLTARTYDTLNKLFSLIGSRLDANSHTAIRDNLQLVLDAPAAGERESPEHQERLQAALARLGGELQIALAPVWAAGSSDSLIKLCDSKDKEPDQQKVAETLAAEFVALRYLAFIRYVVLQMRNLLNFVSAGFVLLVLSLSSYPFLSQHLMAWTIGIMFVILAFKVGVVLAQMDRDPTLSRITDTEGGKLGKEFYLKLAAFMALPAATLASTYFPPIGRFIGQLAQPALDALH